MLEDLFDHRGFEVGRDDPELHTEVRALLEFDLKDALERSSPNRPPESCLWSASTLAASPCSMKPAREPAEQRHAETPLRPAG